MNKAFQKHYSDDLLVAHLDGELSPFRRKSVQKHLQACWQCRVRLDELEQQILAVTRLVERDMFPGPQRVTEARSRFWARASAVTESHVPRTGTRFQWFPLRPAWVISCLLVLLGVAWFWLRPRETNLAPPAVMARAAQAESALLQGPVHQQFRVVAVQVRPAQRRHESRLDVWYQPGRECFTSRLEDNTGKLRHALWRPAPGRDYVYDPARSASAVLITSSAQQPLSSSGVAAAAGAFASSMDPFLRDGLALEDLEQSLMRWLEKRRWMPISLAADLALMTDDQGTVLRLETALAEGGGSALRLLASKSRGTVTVQFMIEVNRQTYRPHLQTIRYETPSAVLELQLIPERVQVLTPVSFEPDASLVKPAPSFLAKLPHPRELAPIRPGRVPAAQHPAALEIETLYALHRVNACLGEPVEVIAKPDGTVLVRGVTATVERKQQVLAALAEMNAPARLAIDIKSTEEALREVGTDRVTVTTSAPRAVPSPFLKQLQRYFPGQGTEASRAAERFSEDAVSLIEGLMTEAWALQRLATRFGSGRDSDLSPENKRLLEAMCQDHLRELHAKAEQARILIEPVFSAMYGGGRPMETGGATGDPAPAWDALLLRVFGSARQIHTRTLDLFEGTKSPGVTGAVIRDLLAGFPELDAGLQGAAARIAILLEARPRVGRNQEVNPKQ